MKTSGRVAGGFVFDGRFFMLMKYSVWMCISIKTDLLLWKDTDSYNGNLL